MTVWQDARQIAGATGGVLRMAWPFVNPRRGLLSNPREKFEEAGRHFPVVTDNLAEVLTRHQRLLRWVHSRVDPAALRDVIDELRLPPEERTSSERRRRLAMFLQKGNQRQPLFALITFREFFTTSHVVEVLKALRHLFDSRKQSGDDKVFSILASIQVLAEPTYIRLLRCLLEVGEEAAGTRRGAPTTLGALEHQVLERWPELLDCLPRDLRHVRNAATHRRVMALGADLYRLEDNHWSRDFHVDEIQVLANELVEVVAGDIQWAVAISWPEGLSNTMEGIANAWPHLTSREGVLEVATELGRRLGEGEGDA